MFEVSVSSVTYPASNKLCSGPITVRPHAHIRTHCMRSILHHLVMSTNVIHTEQAGPSSSQLGVALQRCRSTLRRTRFCPSKARCWGPRHPTYPSGHDSRISPRKFRAPHSSHSSRLLHTAPDLCTQPPSLDFHDGAAYMRRESRPSDAQRFFFSSFRVAFKQVPDVTIRTLDSVRATGGSVQRDEHHHHWGWCD